MANQNQSPKSSWLLTRLGSTEADAPSIILNLREGRSSIGRGVAADITLDNRFLSRKHCEVIVAGETVKIKDLKVCNWNRQK